MVDNLQENGNDDDPIVIILHEGLREFVYATGAFRQIREVFSEDKLILLTTERLHYIAVKTGYFDDVIIDPMYNLMDVHKIFDFRRQLLDINPKLVIDLQNSSRSHWYFKLSGHNKPDWNAIIKWCAYPFDVVQYFTEKGEEFDDFHILEFHVGQMLSLGMDDVNRDDISPDLSWVNEDISNLGLNDNYVLIAPAPPQHKDILGWEKYGFVALIGYFLEHDIQVILIGDEDDEKYSRRIKKACKNDMVVNLVGQLQDSQIAQLAKGALLAIGNDCGAMYLTTYMNCPTIFLCSMQSDLEQWMPDRKSIRVIQDENIEEISINLVLNVIDDLSSVDNDAQVYKVASEEEKLQDDKV